MIDLCAHMNLAQNITGQVTVPMDQPAVLTSFIGVKKLLFFKRSRKEKRKENDKYKEDLLHHTHIITVTTNIITIFIFCYKYILLFFFSKYCM